MVRPTIYFQPHSPVIFLGCMRKIGQTHRICDIDYWMQLLVTSMDYQWYPVDETAPVNYIPNVYERSESNIQLNIPSISFLTAYMSPRCPGLPSVQLHSNPFCDD